MPDDRDRPRPSLPHSHHRAPTGPRLTVPQHQAPAEAAEELHAHYDPQTFELAQKVLSGIATLEDFLALHRIVSRETVVQTRQDDKLRVDNRVGMIESKIESMQTIADQKIARKANFWRAIAVTMLSIAGTVGVAAATCANAYQTARADAIEPAQRAEAKAEHADEKVETVASEMEARMKASEDRHIQTERELAAIKKSVDTANTLLVGIAAKLEEK